MDDFIVKIYRHEDRKTLIGLVEDMHDGIKKKFHSNDELLKILQKSNEGMPVDRKGGKENCQR
jgi:hypothetical protein